MYIIDIKRPENICDKDFHDETIVPGMNCKRKFNSQVIAGCIADDINRNYPGAGAVVKEYRPKRRALSLAELWRMEDLGII